MTTLKTPNSFFTRKALISDVMTNRFYQEQFSTIDQFKAAIEREVSAIDADKDLLRKVCLSVTYRIKERVDANGAHIEKER